MNQPRGTNTDMMLALAAATAFELRGALTPIAPELVGAVPDRGSAVVRLHDREALLLVTGVGPLNAALEAGAALERHAVTGMLHLGIAGSFDLSAAPLCSAVAASSEAYGDFGLADEHGLADAAGFAFPQWADGNGRVFERLALDPEAAATALGLTLPSGWRRAAALTSAAVTADAQRARKLATRHGALIESMEGFALALACRVRGLPFLEVRTISNAVGERDKTNWKLTQAAAALGDVLDALLRGPAIG